MTVRSGVANGGGRRREGAHGAGMGEALSPRLPLAWPVPRPRPRHPAPPSSIGTGAPAPPAPFRDAGGRETTRGGRAGAPSESRGPPRAPGPPSQPLRCRRDERDRVGGAFQLNFSDHLHQCPRCSCAAAWLCTRCCARTAKCTGFACGVSRLAARHRRSTGGRLALESEVREAMFGSIAGGGPVLGCPRPRGGKLAARYGPKLLDPGSTPGFIVPSTYSDLHLRGSRAQPCHPWQEFCVDTMSLYAAYAPGEAGQCAQQQEGRANFGGSIRRYCLNKYFLFPTGI
jgi:hypothetical protein